MVTRSIARRGGEAGAGVDVGGRGQRGHLVHGGGRARRARPRCERRDPARRGTSQPRAVQASERGERASGARAASRVFYNGASAPGAGVCCAGHGDPRSRRASRATSTRSRPRFATSRPDPREPRAPLRRAPRRRVARGGGRARRASPWSAASAACPPRSGAHRRRRGPPGRHPRRVRRAPGDWPRLRAQPHRRRRARRLPRARRGSATRSSGTVELVGTPAEEGGGGKIRLLEAGVFDGVSTPR